MQKNGSCEGGLVYGAIFISYRKKMLEYTKLGYYLKTIFLNVMGP
jgi:hypothetical protein